MIVIGDYHLPEQRLGKGRGKLPAIRRQQGQDFRDSGVIHRLDLPDRLGYTLTGSILSCTVHDENEIIVP